MTSTTQWPAFPHAQDDYDYAGSALHKAWDRLHGGDREPWPDTAWVKKTCAGFPAAAQGLGELADDPKTVAARLQEAWRSFHRGDFREAMEQGVELGLIGYAVANKAQSTVGNYLVEDGKAKSAMMQATMARAEQAMESLPEHPNSWYLNAYAIGRYAQCVSVAEALAEGLGKKVTRYLRTTLNLEPSHADAHTATGVFHAEVIDKVGAMIGGMTFGANKEEGLKHFRKGIELAPHSASALMEYADGLLMLEGKGQTAEAIKLYEKAAAMDPADALERLDVELAKSQLE
ncbi:hypothetical protein H0Z60_10575 [Ectothiorhodospiraceae bacterium WFHF3C12]|nr:hypothetical protein [Ectothiorhodospiraceae bacterium WFHF3C12]